MNTLKSLSLMMASLLSFNLYAANVVEKHIEQPIVVGEGRLTYLFWDVYDATLIAPKGVWNADKPFALKLRYLRQIEGKQIADRSVQEMRDQGIRDEIKLATWHTQMRQIFPDVDEGTVLIGIQTAEGEAVFYHNGQPAGTINSPEFSRAFFNIWLSDKTSSPKLRQKLLGR